LYFILQLLLFYFLFMLIFDIYLHSRMCDKYYYMLLHTHTNIAITTTIQKAKRK